MTRRSGRLLPVVASLVVAGCAPTRYEGAADSTVAATTTTEAITGTASELLVELADAVESLSRVMLEEGDDEALLARIVALWDAARAEVSSTRPDLVPMFQAQIDRCGRAVEFNRAADADKSARNVRALVDSYLAAA